MSSVLPTTASAPEFEGAVAARRLGVRLGCDRALLVGCSHPALELELGSVFCATVVDQLSPEGADPLDSTLVLIGAGIVARDSRDVLDTLRQLLATAPAVVVLDPDGDLAGRSLDHLVHPLRAAKLEVWFAGYVNRPGVRGARRDSPVVVCGDGHDRRAESLLAAGLHSLALDPLIELDPPGARPARVCIASSEVTGVTKTGGIGTGNTALALALARAGHEVTLLYTGLNRTADWASLRARFAESSVAFEPLPHAATASPHREVRRSHELYRWLWGRGHGRSFDVVHFPERGGHPYFTVLAKHQGLAFDDTTLVVGAHSSVRWLAEANRTYPNDVDALVEDHMERWSVALADVVVSPSAYLLDYMRERGWTLPARTYVQQYVQADVIRALAGRAGEAGTRSAPLRELVFFGRMETAKGVEVFCDALDTLVPSPPVDGLTVTFLGSAGKARGVPGDEYVQRRSARWPWKTQVLTGLGQDEAVEYLHARPCLAVMPSVVDNLPNTVIEALALGIPFLAARSGGIPELIDPRDLELCTFEHPSRRSAFLEPVPLEENAGGFDARPLAEALRERLDRPPGRARFAVDPDSNERCYSAWHEAVAAARDRSPYEGQPSVVASVGLLSVCVVCGEDAGALARVVDALAAQDDDLFEIVVVDETGADGEPIGELDQAGSRATARGWQVVRCDEPGPAAARGEAIRAARGGLILFLRTSEVPEPGLVRTIRHVAARTGADVVAPVVRVDSEGDDLRLVPVGGPALAGLVYPAFAAGAYAITREALDRLGGFAADCLDELDHDLLNRAVLAGLTVEVVPEALTVAAPDAWTAFRSNLLGSPDSVYDSEALARIARPFRALLPAALVDLPSVYQTDRRIHEALKVAARWKGYHDLVVTSRAWRVTEALRGAVRRGSS